jgi:hypothetical protein
LFGRESVRRNTNRIEKVIEAVAKMKQEIASLVL